MEVNTVLVNKIERGERKTNREQVIKLAELLEVDEDEPLAYKALKNSEND
ncbi:helix-turn-helix domain-containing protein [Flavobacterium succinicans]